MKRKPALPADISKLRLLLRRFHDEQLELLHCMMDCGPMIIGSLYETYRTCSYPACRCHKGQKHGPIITISFSIDGKHRSRPVRRDNIAEVTKKAIAYKRFQAALTRWRALHKESEAVLERIRELSAEPYQ